jgi:hypothetical protein
MDSNIFVHLVSSTEPAPSSLKIGLSSARITSSGGPWALRRLSIKNSSMRALSSGSVGGKTKRLLYSAA